MIIGCDRYKIDEIIRICRQKRLLKNAVLEGTLREYFYRSSATHTAVQAL